MTAARDEHGFTLVELLIAVSVLGVIVLALGAAFSVGLRTMDTTTNRLAGSMDAQLLGVHLPDDVASATVITTAPAAIVCTGVASPVLQLADGAFNVVYGVRAARGEHQLERHDCSGGAVRSTIVVARHLGGMTAAVATRIPASGAPSGATITLTEATVASEPVPFVFSVTAMVRSS